jgi:molybdopterin biosynthesis enzyme
VKTYLLGKFSIRTNYLFYLQSKYIQLIVILLFSSAMGYVIDAPVYSSENLPPYPASIKDGYAIKYVCDGSWSQKNNIFEVVQVSVAGTEVIT